METNWNVILRRSGLVVICLSVLFFEAVMLSKGSAVGCSAEDLELQNILPAQASTDSAAPQEKVVYLTFDDGPSKITEQVLDTLKAENVPATFFVISAENNAEYLPLLSRTVSEGHVVALHTCTHAYKEIYASPEAFWQDIENLKTALAPYGCSESKILRFPGGSTNTVSYKYGGSGIMKTLKAQALERGYRFVDWNISADDSLGGKPSASHIYSKVINGVGSKTSCVVLMHDSSINKATAQALPDIITWFKNAGFRFDTIDHLPEAPAKE